MPETKPETLTPEQRHAEATQLFDEWWQDVGEDFAFQHFLCGVGLSRLTVYDKVKAVWLDGYLMNERH